MPTYGLGSTATNLLTAPYGGISPVGPAGQTDLSRQGDYTTLAGIASQYAPSQQYAQQAGQYAGQFGQDFMSRMNNNGFGANPMMNQAFGLAGSAVPGNQYTGAAGNLYRQASHQPAFGAGLSMLGNSLNASNGGYSTGLADTINTTGASFDPYNNPALADSISEANDMLGRDFRQNVMPTMDRAAIGSGVGGYGGARAGVAQGMREQSLADSMSKQTADMMSAGYESGLNRYVGDRANTVNATVGALDNYSNLGLSAAGTAANIGNMQGNLNLGAGQGLGDLSGQQRDAALQASQIQSGLGQYGLGQNNSMYQYGTGMMPDLQDRAYQGALQPGQTMQQLGGAMSGMGQQQQANNQAVADWYNSQYNAAQAYPQQNMTNYVNQMGSILTPSGTQQAQPMAPSPIQGMVQGGTLGYGLANAWNQGNQGSTQWGTNPGSQQTQMLNQQWQ